MPSVNILGHFECHRVLVAGAPVERCHLLHPRTPLPITERAAILEASRRSAVAILVCADPWSDQEHAYGPDDFDAGTLRFALGLCKAVALIEILKDRSNGAFDGKIADALRASRSVVVIRTAPGGGPAWWPLIEPRLAQGMELIAHPREVQQ